MLRLATFLLSAFALFGQNEPAIKSGETLRITVVREADFTRTVTVNAEGNVIYPLIGAVKAEGLSTAQLSEEVRKALSQYILNPQVSTERASQ